MLEHLGRGRVLPINNQNTVYYIISRYFKPTCKNNNYGISRPSKYVQHLLQCPKVLQDAYPYSCPSSHYTAVATSTSTKHRSVITGPTRPSPTLRLGQEVPCVWPGAEQRISRRPPKRREIRARHVGAVLFSSDRSSWSTQTAEGPCRGCKLQRLC